jgi:hypothetical protein
LGEGTKIGVTVGPGAATSPARPPEAERVGDVGEPPSINLLEEFLAFGLEAKGA